MTSEQHDRAAHEVPAGRGGADSGAADLVDVEGTAPASPEEGDQNDIAGVGSAGPGDDRGLQTEPREDTHDTTSDERVRGILVQVQGDLATGRASEEELRRMLRRRLDDAGIELRDEQFDGLIREAVSGEPDTTIEGAEPGADA
ncbi:hypothetical protein QMO46_15035 [Microbacterium barkeri]|uniref:hypothetical protein n=1 Tax=Microbacterium barkeri TaxID=33917 RepID=UPI0024AF7047|nr:hypothetical protein [Microbacterium barkeri]MDI6944804.1 hypothetical protein [Microbacterium barkeri]